MKHCFAVYKRDEEPHFELRQLSDLCTNARDSRLIGRCDRFQLEAWLRNRKLAPTVDGEEITSESILASLNVLGSAKFVVRDS